VVETFHEINIASPRSVTVKSIVVSNELLIDPKLGAIVTLGTDSPDTGGWEIDKAIEDGSDVGTLIGGDGIFVTILEVDVLDDIKVVWHTVLEVNVSKLAPVPLATFLEEVINVNTFVETVGVLDHWRSAGWLLHLMEVFE
jgi:hypothetical protein